MIFVYYIDVKLTPRLFWLMWCQKVKRSSFTSWCGNILEWR